VLLEKEGRRDLDRAGMLTRGGPQAEQALAAMTAVQLVDAAAALGGLLGAVRAAVHRR